MIEFVGGKYLTFDQTKVTTGVCSVGLIDESRMTHEIFCILVHVRVKRSDVHVVDSFIGIYGIGSSSKKRHREVRRGVDNCSLETKSPTSLLFCFSSFHSHSHFQSPCSLIVRAFPLFFGLYSHDMHGLIVVLGMFLFAIGKTFDETAIKTPLKFIHGLRLFVVAIHQEVVQSSMLDSPFTAIPCMCYSGNGFFVI